MERTDCERSTLPRRAIRRVAGVGNDRPRGAPAVLAGRRHRRPTWARARVAAHGRRPGDARGRRRARGRSWTLAYGVIDAYRSGSLPADTCTDRCKYNGSPVPPWRRSGRPTLESSPRSRGRRSTRESSLRSRAVPRRAAGPRRRPAPRRGSDTTRSATRRDRPACSAASRRAASARRRQRRSRPCRSGSDAQVRRRRRGSWRGGRAARARCRASVGHGAERRGDLDCMPGTGVPARESRIICLP